MTDRLERWRVLRQRLRDEGLCQPWFDVCKSYDFPFFTPEQLDVLSQRDWRWLRPRVTLEEFLRSQNLEAGLERVRSRGG